MIYIRHVYDLLLAEKSHVAVRSFTKIAPKSNVHLDLEKQEVLTFPVVHTFLVWQESYTCMIYIIHVYDLLLAEKSHVAVRSFTKIAPKSNVEKQDVLTFQRESLCCIIIFEDVKSFHVIVLSFEINNEKPPARF